MQSDGQAREGEHPNSATAARGLEAQVEYGGPLDQAHADIRIRGLVQRQLEISALLNTQTFRLRLANLLVVALTVISTIVAGLVLILNGYGTAGVVLTSLSVISSTVALVTVSRR